MSRKKLTVRSLKSLHIQKLQELRDITGKQIASPINNVEAYLQECINTKPPRSLMYIYNMVEDEITWHHGLDLIGLSTKNKVDYSELTARYHKNQQKAIWYIALRMQDIFIKFKGEVANSGFYFISRRSIRDASGKYWNAHYVGQSIQYDENRYGISYFSRWLLLNEYQGEPLTAEFIYSGKESKKYEATIKKMNIELEKIKAEIIDYLGFTRLQKQVLKYLACGNSTKEIAAILDLTEKAVSRHNENILKTGKELFPINNFKYAADVAEYLKIQDFI